jgi:hypothetical protein
LTYSNVGTTPPKTGTVLFAHIHFGKSRDSGGVLVFFCTNATFTGTGPTPQSCPQNSGTVSGMWTAANVQAIAGQNVAAGDFDALVDALTSTTAYANVHTTSGTTPENAFPGARSAGRSISQKKRKSTTITAINQIVFGVAFLAPKVRNGSTGVHPLSCRNRQQWVDCRPFANPAANG